MVLGLATPGCTWVSAKDYAEKVGSVDNDGDGFSSPEDCDDNDPNIFPDAEDAWYDGIDANCLGDDDYDADGDQFVPDEYVEVATNGLNGSGHLRGGDCDDTDPTVNPIAVDTWYDGIDTDCAGNDDNDADADGFGVDAGDCADSDPSVFPGAEDIWLDGVDSDCAGNSDYDADGDGYAPPGLENEITLYAESAAVLLPGDCDDEDADVNPGAVEVYYDDKDNDCDPSTNDLDADGDGFLGGAVGDDCDDTNSSVFPGATEVVTDAVDFDCDGDGETFADANLAAAGPLFDASGTATFNGLRRIRLAPGAANLWLAVAADEMELPLYTGAESAFDSIVAFAIPLDDTARGITRRQYLLFHPVTPPDYALGDAIDFAVMPSTGTGGRLADVLVSSHSLLRGTERLLRLAGFSDVTRQSLGAHFAVPSGTDYSSISVQYGDASTFHAVGCSANDSSVDILSATVPGLATGSLVTSAALTGYNVNQCGIDTSAEPTMGIVSTSSTGAMTRSTYSRIDPGAGLATVSGFPGTVAALDASDSVDRAVVAAVSTSGTVSVYLDTTSATLSGVSASGDLHVIVTGTSTSASAPELVVSGVLSDGSAGFYAIGTVAGGFDVYPMGNASGGTVTDAAAWLDEGGRIHTFQVVDGTLRVGSASL